MSSATLTKSTKSKSKRIQIAFTSSPAFASRIESLSSKYYGMSVAEIFKMAIIKLDNEEDESAYIRRDKQTYATLLKYKDDGSSNAQSDKLFKNIKELEDAFNII
jgi:hypothetical protein